MAKKMTKVPSQLYSTWVWGILPGRFFSWGCKDMLNEIILGVCEDKSESPQELKLIFQKYPLAISVCLHRLFEHDEGTVCAAHSADIIPNSYK